MVFSRQMTLEKKFKTCQWNWRKQILMSWPSKRNVINSSVCLSRRSKRQMNSRRCASTLCVCVLGAPNALVICLWDEQMFKQICVQSQHCIQQQSVCLTLSFFVRKDKNGKNSFKPTQGLLLWGVQFWEQDFSFSRTDSSF